MHETLKRLNEQAIKDGLLLPDDSSYRKDFSIKLGQDLLPIENRVYRIIHDLTKTDITGIIPVSVGEIFKSVYNPEASYQITICDKEIVQIALCKVRKKLGKMAIENIQDRGNHDCGYYSRRKAIELAVKSNFRKS
ncbi:MAG: hypothetical protein NTZ07_00620 [Candidatus Woesebacteria bacterium]|nr:hypothetical protein [Candidatus Woesebacteria bacterium]